MTLLSLWLAMVFCSCSGSHKNNEAKPDDLSNQNQFYFDFTIDGKEFHIAEEDILTSYKEFGENDKEFKFLLVEIRAQI